MSQQPYGKTWADFFSENKVLVWLIFLVAICLTIFLIYNKWGIRYGDFEFSPPNDQSQKSTVLELEPTSTNKDSAIIYPNNTRSNTTIQHSDISKTPINLNENNTQVYQSFITGTILDADGKPAVNAKVECDNCLTSNSPRHTDEFGRFRVAYQVEYKTNEYSLKSIEFTIVHNHKSYSASQRISQKSLQIELK